MSNEARDSVTEFIFGEFEAPKAAPPKDEEPGGYHPDQFELLKLGRPEEDPRLRAQRQAQQIVADAEDKVNQARQSIEDAKTESEAIRHKAYEDGYQQGLEEGAVASRARIEAAMSNIERAVNALDSAKVNVLGNLEREIIALVQAAVDGLFVMEDALPRSLIGAVVRRAIEQVVSSGSVVVRCSRTDIDTISELQPDLLERFSSLERVDILPHDDLGPGDCMVEAADTVIDATLATRRKAIFEQLEQSLRNGPPLDISDLAAKAPETSMAEEGGWEDAPADDPEQW